MTAIVAISAIALILAPPGTPRYTQHLVARTPVAAAQMIGVNAPSTSRCPFTFLHQPESKVDAPNRVHTSHSAQERMRPSELPGRFRHAFAKFDVPEDFANLSLEQRLIMLTDTRAARLRRLLKPESEKVLTAAWSSRSALRFMWNQEMLHWFQPEHPIQSQVWARVASLKANKHGIYEDPPRSHRWPRYERVIRIPPCTPPCAN